MAIEEFANLWVRMRMYDLFVPLDLDKGWKIGISPRREEFGEGLLPGAVGVNCAAFLVDISVCSVGIPCSRRCSHGLTGGY
jgi:hypothetical protein